MAKDSHGRRIDYLRISVTERCNFRCIYCMPDEGIDLKRHDQIMTIEEIARLVRVSAKVGITRVRLTGGEPLVRLGITDLVRYIHDTPGIDAVTMTTNAALLPRYADELKEAGLKRVNISLDSLDPVAFKKITKCGTLDQVLEGINAALRVGFDPVKINTVVIRSLNQDVLQFAKLSVDRPLHVRFIEYMPVGDSAGFLGQGWTEKDCVPSKELKNMIDELSVAQGGPKLVPAVKERTPETFGPAEYFEFPGAQGTVGFISSRSRHFCSSCNRLRVTSDGKLRPCLFSDLEVDLMPALRGGSDDELLALLNKALEIKPDEHHDRIGTERGMSQIGG